MTTKTVRWGGVQVLEFCVGYSSCAVPSTGGPPIGLVGWRAIRTQRRELSADPQAIEDEDRHARPDMRALWLDPRRRAKLLRAAHYAQEDIALMCGLLRVLEYSRRLSRLDAIQPEHADDQANDQETRRDLPSARAMSVMA